MSVKVANTREYNQIGLHKRNPKKCEKTSKNRGFWGQLKKICKNSVMVWKILKVVRSYVEHIGVFGSTRKL